MEHRLLEPVVLLDVELDRALDRDEGTLDDDREVAVSIEESAELRPAIIRAGNAREKASGVEKATRLPQLEGGRIGDVLEADLRNLEFSLERVLCVSERRLEILRGHSTTPKSSRRTWRSVSLSTRGIPS